MKLFKTSDMEIVKYCQPVFNVVIPSVQIAQKSEKIVKNLTLYMNAVHDDISVNLCCKIDSFVVKIVRIFLFLPYGE